MKLSLLLWLTSVLPQPVADQTCLATTVYLEARSQSNIGQQAVAEVALRRRERSTQGTTVCDVVKAPHQFAVSTTPRNFDVDNADAYAKAWQVASYAIANWKLPVDERTVLVPHADHFATVSTSPRWLHSRAITTIGAHRFYAVD